MNWRKKLGSGKGFYFRFDYSVVSVPRFVQATRGGHTV